MNISINRSQLLTVLVAVVALPALLASPVLAQSRYWDANGTVAGAGVTPNGTWGTDNFWNTDPVGGAGTFSSALSSSLTGVFSAGTDATGSYAVSLNGTQLAQAININYGNSFTLANGVLALTRAAGSSATTGVISTASTMTGTAEIASTIQLNTAAGTSVLNLIAGNGSAATDLLISGPIANDNTATSYQIRLGGAGNGRITAALNNANATYGSSITANTLSAWTGTWTIAGNQTLGGSVALTLNAANNKLVMGDSTSDTQSWGGTTTVSASSAALTIKSTATIGAVTIGGGGGTMAVGGSVSGGTLTVGTGGNGVLQMADGSTGGSATFTGLTISGTGNKIVGAAGGTGTFTLNLASGATTIGSGLTLGGAAANENNLNLNKSGAGTLVLSAANTFSGTTRITAGGLVLADQNAIQNSTLTMTNAGTLVFSNSVAGNAFTVGALAASATGAGYDIVLTNSAGTAIALTAGGNNQSTTYAGILSGAGGSLVKAGTGTLTLSGANSYGRGTLVSGGTLAGSTASLQGTITNNATVVFAQSTNGTFGSVISGGGSVVKSGAGTLTLSVTNSYTGATDIAQGTLLINSSGGLATASAVQISNGASIQLARGSGASLVFGNTISGEGGVIKSSTADVTLASANSYTGGTTLLGDNLILGVNGALGTGPLTINSTAATARLNLNGTTNTVTGLTFVAGANSQVIQNQGSGGSAGRLIISLDTGVTASTLSSTFIRDGSSGTLALTKSGAGTLDLTALNTGSTYSGGLTVNAGTVRYAGFQAFGNSSVTLAGGALDFNSSGTLTVTPSVSLATDTTSTLTNAAGEVTFSGNFTGAGALTKRGAGTTTLTGSNSFTGATVIASGTLKVATTTLGGALDTTASVTVQSGAVLLLAANNEVNDAAGVTLSGGTIRRDGDFTEVFGDLNLTAASFLDYGTGAAGTLRFGAYTPVELLTVQNFSVGSKLQFGNSISAGDLTSKFSFSNAYTTGTEGGFFTITAIPEPSTVVAAIGLAGLLAFGSWRSRRRLKTPTA
jgi:fibronectin-binding autotransporter adhesin